MSTAVAEPEATTEFAPEKLEAGEAKEKAVGEIKVIKIADIKLEDEMQMRQSLNSKEFEAAVLRYTEALEAGKTLPAVKVFDVLGKNEGLYLVDGFARIKAHTNRKLDEIEAELAGVGSYKDARLMACGMNAEHGLPRSAGDLAKSVLTAKSLMGAKASHRKIADVVKCSFQHVGRILAAAEGTTPNTSGNKPPKTKKPKGEQAEGGAETTTSEGGVTQVTVPMEPVKLTDAKGKPIPEEHITLQKDFQAARLIELAESLRVQIANHLLEAAGLCSQSKDADALKMVVQEDLELIHKTLKAHCPHAICKECGGEGCPRCDNRGFDYAR